MDLSIPTIDITLVFYWIYNLFTTGGFALDFSPQTIFLAKSVWFGLGWVALLFIVTVLWQILKLERKESINLDALPETGPGEDRGVNNRWFDLVRKIESDNPSDWNLAIIEADKILDEMVEKMGHAGENLGERLKNIEPSDFLTLNDAWQAHKIRNSIAHESDFVLTRREAQKTLRLYENVFKEFKFI